MSSYASETVEIQVKSAPIEAVNYDGPPLVETEIEGTRYRIDSGKQGTAICISVREGWDWRFGSEARWDGSVLRSKAFERGVLTVLSLALKEALAGLE